jgi:hypothetical protein
MALMRPRKKVAVLAVVALALSGILVAVVVRFADRGPHPTAERYDRIQLGMSKQEVVAILGGPPCNRVAAYNVLPADGILYHRPEESAEGTVCSFY